MRLEKIVMRTGSTMRIRIGASRMPQTAPWGASKRPPIGEARSLDLGADPGRQCRGQQADASDNTGHEDRAHLYRAGTHDGTRAIHAVPDQLVVVGQDDDAVHGGDAEQGDEADGG